MKNWIIPIFVRRGITVTKAQVQVDDDQVFSAMQISGAKTVIDLAGRYPLPNLVDAMMHLLENTTPPVRLTRQTLLEIFSRTQKQQAALDNPHEFASVVVRIIKEKLTDQLVDGIKYEKIGQCYEMCQLRPVYGVGRDHLIPAKRSIYDKVIFDSEVERKFVEGLEKLDFVKLYVKLPAFFKVPTPIGSYNPDWAIVVEPRDELESQPGNRCSIWFGKQRAQQTLTIYVLMSAEKLNVVSDISERHSVSIIKW